MLQVAAVRRRSVVKVAYRAYQCTDPLSLRTACMFLPLWDDFDCDHAVNPILQTAHEAEMYGNSVVYHRAVAA